MTDITSTTALSSLTATDFAVPVQAVGASDSQGHVQEAGFERVGDLLAGLRDSAPQATASASEDQPFENRLAVVRLGMATSLFYSLRTKHAATAGHCLRVALSCSAWAERLGLDSDTRDRIEVAALLHDLGKIGIPDRILRKPGKLSVDEQLSMELIPELGCEILRGCTSDQDLLDIVRYANTWFDSRRHEEGPRGDALPIGSRMLAIADAFDAMTTDTVYRRAMSRERAIQELMQGGASQFDPELVRDFSRMLEARPEMLQQIVVDRWLRQLHKGSGPHLWGAAPADNSMPSDAGRASSRESLFHQQLIGNLKDGIAFTDAEGTIIQWNATMQHLTSIAPEAIVGQSWSNESLRLRQQDQTRDDCESFVRDCLDSGTASTHSMLIEQPGRTPTPVQIQVSPVVGSTPGIHGTIVIVRDLSDQATLEEELETLHVKTTLDPLTNIANRAHFDHMLAERTDATSAGGPSFSLIICDIDHFKRVNDVHGHPAGDEALKNFAEILRSHSRDGDTVARYGGEEFLLLAPNCDNATATRRAEAIRIALESTPLDSLMGEAVTASFGVTEFQAGDSPETILARSDRALLKAKDNGRNRVIQLGAGNVVQSPSSESVNSRGWLDWLTGHNQSAVSEIDIVTPVPVDLAIEKLKGFIADHKAEVIHVDEDQVSLKLNVTYSRGGRRRADQQMAVNVQLTLSEGRKECENRRGVMTTNVHVRLQPIRNRDRRGQEVAACFAQVINSMRSYLMGELKRSDLA
ncbi:putative diguanylate cyclase YdaM [Rubripirellula lacrimiformis]|uniref:diguanylate cyclase n=1 Tax=Rubripirellula lacrimiformis TaxID=1930273 RepID=A0A517N9F2_9BACT|nr:diguanylate cyclase [Rubripirellula lacrimiformis]QDT03765.1 putative diguanylate cyclase YdaM [Rubripirellula lacrimiformis]